LSRSIIACFDANGWFILKLLAHSNHIGFLSLDTL